MPELTVQPVPNPRSVPLNEPKTHHCYMPDGRSLCDRRATPSGEGSVEELGTGPVCGSCLMVLHALRNDLMYQTRMTTEVWPPTAGEALHALEGTRWASFLDMKIAHEAFDGLDLAAIPTIGFTEEEIAAAIEERNERIEQDSTSLSPKTTP